MNINLLPLQIILLLGFSVARPSSAVGQYDMARLDGTPPDSQPTDAPKAYWRVRTDPASRSTTVQFFNQADDVIYEETLSGRYLKLNERTVARLDQLLNRVLIGNLVVAELKTHPLLSERTFYKLRSERSSPETQPAVALPKTTGIHAKGIRVVGQAKLVTQLVNPSGYRVNIRIENERGTAHFWTSMVQADIIQKFDLSALGDGRYALVVSSYNNKDRYTQPFWIKAGKLILTD